jgi:hypothetical protein
VAWGQCPNSGCGTGWSRSPRATCSSHSPRWRKRASCCPAASWACRSHPLTRALRIGRLPLAALAATLRLYRDPERALREVPVLAMLNVDPDRLAKRAGRSPGTPAAS